MSVVSDLNLRLEETDLKKNKKSYPVEFDDDLSVIFCLKYSLLPFDVDSPREARR